MRILTTLQAREIDRHACFDENQAFLFMNRAAEGIAEKIIALLQKNSRILFFCGKGNNGGDGFLAAYHLSKKGYDTHCYMSCEPKQLSTTAKRAFDTFTNNKGNSSLLSELESIEFSADLIVDALLGTGTSGAPRGIYAHIIEMINNSSTPVLAIDIPSGLCVDSGEVQGIAIKAAYTVVPGFLRFGHVSYTGKTLCGEITVHDIQYPKEHIEDQQINSSLCLWSTVPTLIPPRYPAGNKYTHGTVTVIAGSRGMSGAVTLASRAVLRSGAGMCYTILPRSIVNTVATKLNEPVLIEAPETADGSIKGPLDSQLQRVESKTKALLVGPGMSRNRETAQMIRKLVCSSRVPVVLDGDGLSAFEGATELFLNAKSLVLTPHDGEWTRLFGPIAHSLIERTTQVSTVSQQFQCTILLKGVPTVIGHPDGSTTLIHTGNSGMATAGSGDVLAGIIASLIAQEASVRNAVLAGAHIHGRAGDIAATHESEYSLIASDIVDSLGKVFSELRPFGHGLFSVEETPSKQR